MCERTRKKIFILKIIWAPDGSSTHSPLRQYRLAICRW